MPLDVVRLAGISEARPLWHQMLNADPYATFFSSPPWLETWWQHHGTGRELLLLQVTNQGTPVAFAPFMLSTVLGCQCVSFLGTGLSDYADILVDETRASRYDVVTAVLGFFEQSFPQAIFDLQEIPETSPTLNHVVKWLQEKNLTYHVALQDVCPILHLPDTPEAFHKSLKKTFLADIRRGERRLCERGTVQIVDRIRPTDGDWTALRDQLAELQSKRMRAKGQIPMWQGPLGDFVKDVLEQADRAGSLRVAGVYLDGRLIAYELCFVHRRVMYAWSRAFDDEYRNTGPGKIALLHLIETAITEGYQVFDLLRGDEPYKALWTNGVTQNHRVVFVVRPGFRTRLVYQYITSWPGPTSERGGFTQTLPRGETPARRLKMSSLLTKLREYTRQYGFRGLVAYAGSRAIQWFWQRSSLIFYVHEGPSQPVTPKVELRIAPLNADVAGQVPWAHQDWQRRWSRGDVCYAAYVNDICVHTSWITRAGAPVDEVHQWLEPGPDEAYIYDCYTDGRYRGKRIFPAVLSTILEALFAAGVKRVWIAAEPQNISSAKAIRSAGFVEIGTVEYRKFGCSERVHQQVLPNHPWPQFTASPTPIEPS